MNRKPKVTALVGTYRKGGIIDTAVDEILASSQEAGAEVAKIYLIDQHIEFCKNCRNCTQEEGSTRGACATEDDMSALLDEIERSDGLVLASPMNFWTVTAVMKQFIERLVCYAYWPWGVAAPKARIQQKTKFAVIVASSAAPSILSRLTTKMVSLLKKTAGLLGARVSGSLFIGLAARRQRQEMGGPTRRRARRLGQRLVSNIQMHMSRSRA